MTGISVQVMPTSPEIVDAEMPKGVRRGLTEAAVGDWALLPIIVVARFHNSVITICANKTYSTEGVQLCIY